MEYMCNDDYLDETDRDVMYSTREQSSDSEEDSAFAHPKFMRKSNKKDDSDDDFTKDMAEELSLTMQEIQESFSKPECADKSATSTTKNNSKKDSEYYNSIYFDTDESSDEDDNNTEKKPKERRKILSDDELLYDPMLDEKDESWVQENRKEQMFGASKSSSNPAAQKLPDSDGVLSCPACFTTLCFDCQRHDVYKDQYRAMFVSNCYIQFNEQLSCPLKVDKKEKFRKRKRDCETPEGDTSQEEVFHPVKCEECNTKVAVYDRDEVYHFFNVLTSF